MEIVPLDQVDVPENRIRKQFDSTAIAELASSIRSQGLLHALYVRIVNGRYELVAGERRLRALRLLAESDAGFRHGDAVIPCGQVVVTTRAEMSDREAVEAELQENTVRLDITMQERAAATARLHNLRASQKAAVGMVQTVKATAVEIVGDDPSGYQQQQTRDLIIIAGHLDNPEVAKAKSAKEAIKVIQREAAALFANELATRVDLSKLSSLHTLIHGECIRIADDTLLEVKENSILRTFPDKEYDVILTDPPYGVSADDWVALSGSEAATKHQYRDDFEYVRTLMGPFLEQAFRVTKSAGHMYMFCDIRLWPVWAKMAAEVGWMVWPVPLIWDKQGQGMIIGNVDGPRRTYEAILYARCGGRPVQKVGADVLHHAAPQAALHAAQKPVSLFVELLSWSCVAGDKVLDCFAGSGTIFPAANQLRLIATAIEKRADNIVIASARINEVEEKDQSLLSF